MFRRHFGFFGTRVSYCSLDAHRNRTRLHHGHSTGARLRLQSDGETGCHFISSNQVVLLRPLQQDAAAVTSIRAPTCALCDSTLSSCSAPGRRSSRCTFGTNPVALGPSSHSSSHSAHKSRQSLKHTESQSPYFEEFSDHPRDLEELVLLPLLQSHQSPGRLLRVLCVGEDAPYSLLRLHVACFLEESHQRVLVDVLKDVGHGLLSVRRVELVAVDRRADPAAFVGSVGRHVVRVSLCGSDSACVSCEAP